MKPTHTRLFQFLPLILMCCGLALGQEVNKDAVTGGLQNYIEFTQIIPSMDVLLGAVPRDIKLMN